MGTVADVLRRFNESVRETAYDPPDEVLRISDMPRFGHSNDIVSLVGSPSEQRDYLVGLILGAAVIFVVFVCWFVALCVFKCMGQRRVGFLSGAPFEGAREEEEEARQSLPSEPSNPPGAEGGGDELDKEPPRLPAEAHRAGRSWNNRPTRLRVLFLCCGLVFVVFSALLVTKGVASLFQTVNAFQRSLQRTNTIANSIVGALQELQSVASSVQRIYNGLSDEVVAESFCPNDPTLSFSPEAQDIQGKAQEAVDQLGQFRDIFNTSLVGDLQTVVDRYYGFTTPIDHTMDKVYADDWIAILVVVLIDVVAGLMMAGTVMAHFAVGISFYSTLLDYVVCPLMFIISAVCWLVAGLMTLAAGLNGDFCLPGGRYEQSSPDDTILQLLNATGYGPTNEPFDPFAVASFFVLQCTVGSNPFEFAESAVPRVLAGQDVLADMGGLFNNTDNIDLLTTYCGRDYVKIDTVLTQFVDIVSFLLQAAVGVLDLVSCKMLVPLYVNTVYSGMCTYSPTAVYWVFKCALVMAFMSSIMLTIRSSYKRTQIIHPLGDDNDVPDEDAADEETRDVEEEVQHAPTNDTEDDPCCLTVTVEY